MSFTNELSNFNASLEVTELLMKTLENAARNLAARCISEVASRHGFDAEKEIQALGLENLSLIRKQMAKKSAAKGEKKEKKPREPKKSAFPMPFFAENVNTDGCQGLAYNRGLFTQCTKNKCETGFYCKGCQIEADKNSSGQPDCGNVSSRLATGLYEFKDPKGRSPISYIKVITKLNITLEQVSEETGKTGKTIPSEHLVVVEKKLSGRGRPKKVSVVETDDVSTVISDIFSKINLNANEEEVIEEEVVEEEEEVIEVDNKPKKLALSETEKAEKKRLLEAEKAEKAEKKAALEAEKAEKKAALEAEKAEQKRLLEAEKAEKKAALEAEKAEQKRLLEVEKAEKKAALEAEKLEKKRLLEVEKAEKKEKEKEERKSKREAEKGTQKSKKENKDDSDNDSEKAEPVKEAVKEAETPPASAPPNNKVKVSRIQISGKSYLKTVDNVLYDADTRDEVGIWDPETKTIKPLPQEEDEEEQEEEYDSDSN